MFRRKFFLSLIACIFLPATMCFAQTNSADELRIIIQPLLSKLGYHSGVIDGIAGPQTKRSIAAFEKATYGPDDGFLDFNEIDELILQEHTRRKKNSTNVVVQSSNINSEGNSKIVEALETENALLLDKNLEAKNKESVLLSQIDALIASLAVQSDVAQQLKAQKLENESLNDELSTEKNHSTALSTQVDALNSTLADYVNGLALENKLKELSAQRDAANSALGDVQKRIENDFAPKEELNRSQAQVKALNTSLAELTVRLNTQFVPRYEFQEKQVMIDTLNKTLADTAGTAEAKRRRQVNALNGTIVGLQEKIETLNRRKSELWTTLNSFLTDCKNSSSCAMELGLN